MLRRSFLQLLAAAVVTPALTPLAPLVPGVPIEPILAVELTTPYWLLEMQAYERLYASAWAARRTQTLPPTRPGHSWTATFPTKPDVRA